MAPDVVAVRLTEPEAPWAVMMPPPVTNSDRPARVVMLTVPVVAVEVMLPELLTVRFTSAAPVPMLTDVLLIVPALVTNGVLMVIVCVPETVARALVTRLVVPLSVMPPLLALLRSRVKVVAPAPEELNVKFEPLTVIAEAPVVFDCTVVLEAVGLKIVNAPPLTPCMVIVVPAPVLPRLTAPSFNRFN